MKNIILSLIMTGLAGLAISASAQNTPDQNNNDNAPAATDQPAATPADGTAPDAAAVVQAAAAVLAAATEVPENAAPKEALAITPSQGQRSPQAEIQSGFMPPAKAGTNASANDLTLNYTRAPLEMVLNYLADAAGFIIIQETRINSSVTVTVNGKHLTKDEAVDLLNTVLNRSGYAAILDGERTLTILDKNDAKTSRIPVKTGNDPKLIPNNAQIVTQIIPIRFVEARQLVSDLSLFVSPQATVVANEAGNSIVITDTQSNIRHLTEIIQAIDNSAEASTEIRVFALKHASPIDVATELGNVFPSTSGNGTQSPISFGGRGGRGGFGAGGGGNPFAAMFGGGAAAGGGNTSADRIKKATQVNAVADSRIQAVIVTAPKDLMDQIADMIKELDVVSDRDQQVYSVQLNNGDPQQVMQVLQNLFPASSNSRNNSGASQNSILQTRTINANSTMGSTTTQSGIGTTTGGRGGG